MGEHVKIGGESVKIGTCEDMYYARYDQLLRELGRMEHAPGNAEPHEYLQPSARLRYRFPFPDEDGQDLGAFENHDRVFVMAVPADHPALCFDHHQVTSHISAPGGGYGVSLSHECPACDLQRKAGNGLRQVVPLCIEQQAWREAGPSGELCLAVIVSCGWCRAKGFLPVAAAVALAETLRPQGNDDPRFTQDPARVEIARRMLEGYARRIC